MGTVKFVVAVFAQLPLGIGSINSRGSLTEVVLAERIDVLGTLRTIISSFLRSKKDWRRGTYEVHQIQYP